MGTFRTRIGIDFLNTDWELIRGLRHTYDLSDDYPTDTGWSVSGAGGGISIINGSTILAELEDNYADLSQITATSDQRRLTLDVFVKDMFPKDFADAYDATVELFYSAFRSYDGTSRELWRGTYHYPDSNNDLNQSQSITVSSGADGYLDLAALVSQLVAISQNGLLVVKQITDQVGSKHVLGATDDHFLAVIIKNGLMGGDTVRINGHLGFHAGWEASDYDSNWSGTRNDQAVYVREDDAIQQEGSWALATLLRFYGASASATAAERLLHMGDFNGFPGVKCFAATEDRHSLRFVSHGGHPEDIFISNTDFNNPWLWLGGMRRGPLTNQVIEHHTAYRMDSSQSDYEDYDEYSSVHEGSGQSVECGLWDWWESAYYNFSTDVDEGLTLFNNRHRLANNLVYLTNDSPTHSYDNIAA